MESVCSIAPRFAPGIIVATSGVKTLIEREAFHPFIYLQRHLTGDWGDVDPEDWQANQMALEQGCRLVSAYQITPELKVWIITEADRSATTMLLPEEY